jgi:hypothetical protein
VWSAADLDCQWLVDGVPVTGATGQQFTPQPADLGRRVAVTVTATAPGHHITTRTSATTPAVARGSFTTAPVPTVTGSIRVGFPLVARPGTWAPGAALGYQWFAGSTPVTGATGPTYTPAAGDLGKRLTVRVTASAPGYTAATRTSPATAAVAAGTFSAAPVPAVTGTARVDATVTAVPGAWAPGATLSYQWRRNGTVIPGATSARYRLAPADRGASVSVSVTGRRAGYATVTRTSAGRTVSSGVFGSAPTPTVSGRTTVGSVLTARAGAWSPSAALAYRWYRDGAPLAGATRTTYRVTSADHGHRLSVRVTGARAGYGTTARASAATGVVAAPFRTTVKPVIEGAARVGSTLRAVTGTWSPSARASFQWRRDGVAIPGATGATYRLTGSDYRHAISVTVTGQRSTYVTASRRSAATAPVAAPKPTLTRDGMYKVGTNVSPGTYVSSGGDSCYWERRSTAGSSFAGIIANDFGAGQRIVTIASGDAYFSTSRCGTWTRLADLGRARSSMGDGVFAVGEHIRPGRYQTTGSPTSCYWELLSGFSGRFDDLIENDFANGRQYVQVPSWAAGFSSSRCGTWTRIGN